jgi:hypothetical protein
MMSLRIETIEPERSGSRLNAGTTVEWVGRIGHPSSYALLGGRRISSEGVRVFTTGARFKDALSGSADEVRWGLLPEYEAAVAEVLRAQPQPVVISKAAHGAIGSSEHAFRAVALMVCQILGTDLPTSDEDVWKLFDRCQNEARLWQ